MAHLWSANDPRLWKGKDNKHGQHILSFTTAYQNVSGDIMLMLSILVFASCKLHEQITDSMQSVDRASGSTK